MNLVFGSLSSFIMAFFVFSVMSDFSLNDPGFMPPVPPVPPSTSESSVETPVDGRRKCSSCPRRMSKKSADRHTICISCRGFDCDINNRCEECLEWSEDDIKYAKYRKSLKSRESSSKAKTTLSHPPLTPSRRSPQPAPRPSQHDDIQSQVDSLTNNFKSLSDSLTSQLSDFMAQFLCQNQSFRQTQLGPDVGESHPGQTAGESRMFQGEGAPSRTPLVPSYHDCPLHNDSRAPPPEQSGRAPSRSPPFAAPRASTRLRALLQLLRLLHNPPPLVGFRLALLLLGHVMTRRGLTRRPVIVSQSRQLVTLPRLGWLTSFMRSALTLALSSIRRLRGAVSRPGLVSQRLRPRSSASDCTLVLLRYKRRLLLGRSLWLAAPSLCHG